jgi:hypothetical protein
VSTRYILTSAREVRSAGNTSGGIFRYASKTNSLNSEIVWRAHIRTHRKYLQVTAAVPVGITSVHTEEPEKHVFVSGRAMENPRTGSSPYVRKIRPHDRHRCTYQRFTPVRTGNSADVLSTMKVGVIPVRTGNTTTRPRTAPASGSGSSPYGSTPARTGKPGPRRCASGTSRVYPRTHGEADRGHSTLFSRTIPKPKLLCLPTPCAKNR